MAQKKEKMIIIDGNAIIHRSYHALPPTMRTKKGEMTNAIYGFTTFLLRSIKEFKPEYVILTLDMAGPTFRHEQFTEYKGHREKADQELYDQIPRVREVAEAFAIPIYARSGFEADDMIGTIVCKVDGDIDKVILTGDQDTMQLVNEHTKVYTMSRGVSDSVLYDEQAVIEKYGLVPAQMIDYKALRGDPSDNIPGVKGIGEKTATELLTRFKTLDGIYENIESSEIRDRIRQLLKDHKADAYMSRDLATIKCDVDVDVDLASARFGNYDLDAISKLFSELEFSSLMLRVKEIAPTAKGGQSNDQAAEDKFSRDERLFDYQLIDDEKKFEKFFKELNKQKSFTFDTETDGLDPLACKLLGISFSWEEGKAYYLAISNSQFLIPNDLFNYQKEQIHPWLEKLVPIFSDKKILKHGHNMKFDIRVLRANGVETVGADFDTMVASYLLNPGTRQHNLDSLALSELNFDKISKAELCGAGKGKLDFGTVATEKLAIYSAEDADMTERLVKKLKIKLAGENLTDLFSRLEMPLVNVLSKMEDNGILLDRAALKKLHQRVNKRIAAVQAEIWKLAGEEFNIGSTQQLRTILFDKLAISSQGISRSKTGLSTASDELDKLNGAHDIIPLIQDYRELAKLNNTYIEALPQLINQKTGRLHTSFNQAVTATGRLSSTEPNLQNIPIRTELGQEIREAFVAASGYKLVSLDYSQIELRLAAHMSGDQKMIQAFRDKVDIHTLTAAEINGVKLEEVTRDMRRQAKAINFGILYGQGPYGLSEFAGISMNDAKVFIEKYFATYPDVRKYIDRTIEQARIDGYVETLLGRRRHMPDIHSNTAFIRKAAERTAINTPLQGTGADMIKLAMIKCDELISQERLEAKMLLTVHDELLFEIKEELAEKIAVRFQGIMENVLALEVPIVVDIKIGENWQKMFPLDK